MNHEAIANTVDIATNWMPSVRVLGELRAGVITYRNVIREHMLSQTLEEKQAMEKTLAGVVGYPFAAILFGYIIWRSALIALVTGTVTWRGTAYPLNELRANRL